MEGGAWDSGVFETDREFHKTRPAPAHTGAATATATPPPGSRYNPSPAKSGPFGVLVLTLRCVLIVGSLIALVLMASAKGSGTIEFADVSGTSEVADVSGTIKFSDIEAFSALVSFLAIVCFYAVVQLILCLVQVSSTGSFIASPASSASMITFFIDTLLSHGLIGAASAAADSRHFLHQLTICDSASKFCNQAVGSIVIAFLSFAVLTACAGLYPIRLYRMRMN